MLTILSDGTLGPESLTFTRETTKSHAWKGLKIYEYKQPMTLLITHMPGYHWQSSHTTYRFFKTSDIAEWVLNKCALAKPPNPPRPTDQTAGPGRGDIELHQLHSYINIEGIVLYIIVFPRYFPWVLDLSFSNPTSHGYNLRAEFISFDANE